MDAKGQDADQIASRFGVSPDTVWAIWRGDRWKNLADPRQTGSSQTRLSDQAIEEIRGLMGKQSPEEIAAVYDISVPGILNIWRGNRRN